MQVLLTNHDFPHILCSAASRVGDRLSRNLAKSKPGTRMAPASAAEKEDVHEGRKQDRDEISKAGGSRTHEPINHFKEPTYDHDP